MKQTSKMTNGTKILSLCAIFAICAAFPAWAADSANQDHTNPQTIIQKTESSDTQKDSAQSTDNKATAQQSQPLTEESSQSKPTSHSNNASGSIFDDLGGPVVVMGDSYSSGEGSGFFNFDFDGTTCHRSMKSYGGIIGGKDTVLIACSGAKTKDMVDETQSSRDNVAGTQLDQLKSLENPAGLIFLTIGGNDLGFGSIVTQCITNNKCFTNDAQKTDLNESIPTVGSKLAPIYKQILDVANTPENTERRGGKVARLIVSPYPDMFPEENNTGNGISTDQIRDIKSFFPMLNSEIEKAVIQVAKEGYPIAYVKTVEDMAKEHPLYTDSPYFTDISMSSGMPRFNDDAAAKSILPQLSADVLQKLGFLKEGQTLPPTLDSVNEIAHPNTRGYQAWADTLTTWAQGKEANRIPATMPTKTQ